MDKLIDIQNMNLHYKDNIVLNDFNFVIEKGSSGKIVAIVGPSGCGKSTILKIIAGLLEPSKGDVYVLGEKIKNPSGKRGMVFQNYTSFDWLTVLENVEFPLKMKGYDRDIMDKLAIEHIDMIGLKDYIHYYPKQLSGGMKQRVAIARTLINQPDLILMDEPFGALDYFTREDMQDNIINIIKNKKINILFVTHDIAEAVYLAEDIYVMTKKPMDIYSKHIINWSYMDRKKEFKYSSFFVDKVKIIQEEIRMISKINQV